MSVDVFVHRLDRALGPEELQAAVASLPVEASLVRGALLLWGRRSLGVALVAGRAPSPDDPIDAPRHAHVMLSGRPAAWGALLYVGQALALRLEAQVFDPQAGAAADLSAAPSADVLRAWHDAIVAKEGLVSWVERRAGSGAWSTLPANERLPSLLQALPSVTGTALAARTSDLALWRGEVPLPSGGAIRVASARTWRGDERDLTLSARAEDAEALDAVAQRLEALLETTFDRVVQLERP